MLQVRRKVRKGWDRIINDLKIEEPFTIEGMRGAVEQKTGRPLHICQGIFRAGGNAPCGLWVRGVRTDWILVDDDVQGAQYNQTVGHELGHMLLGHQPRQASQMASDIGAIVEMFEHLPPALIRRALAGVSLGRTTYEDSIEEEAENFGTFIAMRVQADDVRTRDRRTDPVLSSLRDSLGLRDF